MSKHALGIYCDYTKVIEFLATPICITPSGSPRKERHYSRFFSTEILILYAPEFLEIIESGKIVLEHMT